MLMSAAPVGFGHNVQVDSEATVLFTAQRYVDSLDGLAKAAAILRLGPLIRCQHLSLSWLSAAATANAASTPDAQGHFRYVLANQTRPVQDLLKMKVLDRSLDVFRDGVKKVKEWPDSWFLGPRMYTLQDSVQLAWQVNVSSIRDAAITTFQTKSSQRIRSPVTVPMRGFTWRFWIVCSYNAAPAGVQLGIFLHPINSGLVAYSQSVYKCSWLITASAGPVRVWESAINAPVLSAPNGYGRANAFRVGTMAGGWDAAAWAAAGLPASGALSFNLILTYPPDM
jgi:hypothetical protein